MPVESTQYEVPGWGFGVLWTSGPVVLAHEFSYVCPPFSDARHDTRFGARPLEGAQGPPTITLPANPAREVNGFVPSRHRPDSAQAPPVGDLVERVRAFLAGEPVRFDDVRLDLGWATPFQRELTHALRTIPWGDVVTYGELAALAGRPGAARAAGSFCATNRFALIVPCHRVVAAGGIGGYGPDGVPIKRRLLALEGVDL